jgi:DNA-binding winged helix-turn-helix (wHTH) protein
MASPAPIPARIRFDAFELDAASGELRKAGILLKLQPQPFRVLLLLIERAGQVVTREEIQRCLWRDSTFVDFEHGINFSINQVRGALADNAENPRYVETLPRRGYRFIGAVEHPLAGTSTVDKGAPNLGHQRGDLRRRLAIASPAIIVELAKKHKIGLMGGFLIALMVIAAAVYGIVSLDSAAEPRTRMILRGDSIRGGSRFTPDGNALVYAAYVDNGSYYNGLWFQPLEGSEGHPIVHFPSGWTTRIQFSPDGQHLGILRTTHTESDIVLLHDTGVSSQ